MQEVHAAKQRIRAARIAAAATGDAEQRAAAYYQQARHFAERAAVDAQRAETALMATLHAQAAEAKLRDEFIARINAKLPELGL